MNNAIATEIRNAAQFMFVDEQGNLWGCGYEEMRYAETRDNIDRLIELGDITYEGPGYYHVNEGYENLFNRL